MCSSYLVFVGLVKEVGRVRVDSWNLLGLVGGFLLFYILRTCGGGFVWQPDNGLEIKPDAFFFPTSPKEIAFLFLIILDELRLKRCAIIFVALIQ